MQCSDLSLGSTQDLYWTGLAKTSPIGQDLLENGALRNARCGQDQHRIPKVTPGHQCPRPPARPWPRVPALAGRPRPPPQRAQTVAPWPRKPTLEGARFHHPLVASRGTSGMFGCVLRAATWVHMWHKRWSDTFLPLSPVLNIIPRVMFSYPGGDIKS
jgi:hypothetical protein